MNTRMKWSVAVCAVLACALSACSSSSSGGKQSGSPASITVATTLQLASVDGLIENLVPLNDTIYDPLVKINGDGSLAPGLATKWTANADATEWTFTLRNGVKWSDGSAFSGDDVVWTYMQSKNNEKSMNHSYVAAMDSVTAVGNTVVFKLSHPYAAWPRQASLLVIIPQKVYTKMGATAFGQHPVSTGAYTVTGFTPGQFVTLKANPTYWAGKPPIDKVTMREIDSESTRLTSLQSGSVDVAVVSPATAAQAKGNSKLLVQATPSNVVTYVGFNVKAPGLDQLPLRQAVSMAIDREAMAKTLFGGAAKPIGQVLAPSVFGYDASVPAPTFDATKAKQLVQQSGYSGQNITFTYPVGPAVPQASQTAQAVQGFLKDVGINTTLKSEPQATFVTDWFSKSLPGMFLFSIQPSTLDADLVFSLLGSTAAHFTDPDVTADLQKQTTETTDSDRKATLLEITKVFNDKQYYVPLLNAETEYVSQKGKVTVTPRADGYLLPQLMK